MSARLVWKAIQEENCFGGDTDACFEKRVFYRCALLLSFALLTSLLSARLMSGLQGSITTQIARDYYFAPQGAPLSSFFFI
jgi:hypothetical protein